MQEILYVIRELKKGTGVKKIAKMYGMSKNTIRKYKCMAEEHSYESLDNTELEATALVIYRELHAKESSMSEEMKAVHVHRKRITELLEQKTKLSKIHQILSRPAKRFSYATLRRYIIREFGAKEKGTIRLPDEDPGEVAEVDFGQLGYIFDPESNRKRRVNALVVTLNYSRHAYVHTSFDQTFDTVISGLEDGFEFFDGVPCRLVIDNMKTAVTTSDKYVPVFNRSFAEYANYRGFTIDATRPASPKDKPKVERQVQYVQQNFFKGETFHSLEDVQKRAVEWCMKIAGERIHGTTRQQPLRVFEAEEKAKLQPLEKERYDPPLWKKAKAHPDYHIQFDKAYYSYPEKYFGCSFWVRGDKKLVRLYYKEECIKTHEKVAPGKRSTDVNDYPESKQSYATKGTDMLIAEAEKAGVRIGIFMKFLLSGNYPWAKLRQAQKLLRLIEKYNKERVESACSRALEYEMIDVYRLEKIIKEHWHHGDQTTIYEHKELSSKFKRKNYEFTTNGGPNESYNRT